MGYKELQLLQKNQNVPAKPPLVLCLCEVQTLP